jgi:hypothetical protein
MRWNMYGKFNPQIKIENWRSIPYLDWLASLPCEFTGRKAVPHHLKCFGWGGTGLKPPDSFCLPINKLEVHMPVHGYGEIGVLRFFIEDGTHMDHDQAKGWLAMKCLHYLKLYLIGHRGLGCFYFPDLSAIKDEKTRETDILAIETLKLISTQLAQLKTR